MVVLPRTKFHVSCEHITASGSCPLYTVNAYTSVFGKGKQIRTTGWTKRRIFKIEFKNIRIK